MNYRHSYHAGSFTDVFKHAILVSLIQSLLQKSTPFCYLDTHAGAGYYDLFAETTQKNKEFESGIAKVFYEKGPPAFKHYLRCIQKINARFSGSALSSLRYYPGSPSIMRYFLRSHDRMILTELHPQEYQILKKDFAGTKQASVHLLDGYQGLKAFLPPKERRGLILIDPPYERPNEFAHIISMLPMALKRFSSGIYAIWYPIKTRSEIDVFHHALKETVKQPVLIAELSIHPENSALLNGSGMAIINPPWQIEQQILEYLPWLWKMLSVQGQGRYQVSQL